MEDQITVTKIDQDILLKAYRMMCHARTMAIVYDEQRQVTQYVHSTSRGHEAIQLATGFQLKPYDAVAPYYRDESLLLGMGWTPYELMLQLLAKKDDPFSGGRSYYSHPSSNREDRPLIPHQSSATGMQAIPTTGVAQGVKYREQHQLSDDPEPPVVICSLGDGSVTEGEVSEAMQFAVLHELPIIYLIQDNDWGISVSADEARAMDAYEFAAGFKGMERMRVDGSDFPASYNAMEAAINYVRTLRKPILVHAKVPLLGHHTSGVRKEWYRTEEDLEKHGKDDPGPKLRALLLEQGIAEDALKTIEEEAEQYIRAEFEKAKEAAEPLAEEATEHIYAPTPITEEKGTRQPEGVKDKVVMVDAALHAMDEILKQHPEALFYGQDVGGRLGGVFREAATLAGKYGDSRIFNTAIQEAYIIGSTAGMSAVGLKPIVEIQFADYLFPGLNQLVTELSKSCFLSQGKFPVSAVIRVPIGAYGGGGPYHSGCHESTITSVKGIKVVYPSNAADLKGLLKGAYYDPNPVVVFEHKGLYWSKVPGTEAAKTVDPAADYIIPLGKARTFLEADPEKVEEGDSLVVITYGMGVHWALNAARDFTGQVEILDLRTLTPLDEEAIYAAVRKHNKAIILTEEALGSSFAQTISGRIAEHCFEYLDAPLKVIGAVDVPAIPLNKGIEAVLLPNEKKVSSAIAKLLAY